LFIIIGDLVCKCCLLIPILNDALKGKQPQRHFWAFSVMDFTYTSSEYFQSFKWHFRSQKFYVSFYIYGLYMSI
jgi:hypothetical protein